MRYPEFLKDNDTIGYVAPAFGCTFDPYLSAFKNALKIMEAKGYGTDIGPNCYQEKGIGISNVPSECGKELNDYYISKDNQALISCGGGELMCEVVPYIDFEKIKNATPKWFMGYSDNTNFTFLEAILSDTASIYGPCIPTFGMEPWHESLEDALGIMSGKISKVSNYKMWEKESLKDDEHPLVPYNLTEETVITASREGTLDFSGRLIGGCMDCLANLVGTDFDKVEDFSEKYKEDGIIWFLEACELNVMSIRRTLWAMKNAGWFKNVKGFLIGRPMCYGQEEFGIDHRVAVTSMLEEYGVPIIMDLDIGHCAPMMPIVCGSTANVHFENNEFSIEYTWK